MGSQWLRLGLQLKLDTKGENTTGGARQIRGYLWRMVMLVQRAGRGLTFAQLLTAQANLTYFLLLLLLSCCCWALLLLALQSSTSF